MQYLHRTTDKRVNPFIYKVLKNKMPTLKFKFFRIYWEYTQCIIRYLTNGGCDFELVKHIRENVSIPVIASFGAGKVEHSSEVFEETDVEAALAAGIFHREEVPIEAVKKHMREREIETR